MPDIDRIIEELLGNRRLSESATFSTRSYSDQPLIEKGSDLKARMEQRAQERAARHEREARERREKAQGRRPEQQGSANTQNRHSNVSSSSFNEQDRQPTRQRVSYQDAHKPIPTQELTNEDASSFLDELIARAQRQAASLGSRAVSHLSEELTAQEPLPDLIKQMRKMQDTGMGVRRSLAYGSKSHAELFYQQARLMEHYEDDRPYNIGFLQYYPTYASMSDAQLRGYFTWRTHVRAGQVEAAPLSFAFVYAYELLMGIGTTPGPQGLADLRAFGQAFCQTNERESYRLNYYLRDWLEDYAVYHGIPEAYRQQSAVEQDHAVLTLFKAEHAYLLEHKRKPQIPHPSVDGSMPTDEQIFQALGSASSYHICTSRMAKSEPELLRAVALDVFYALVMHCSKRRKTDYVEGLFGYSMRHPYTMFSAAVFYESEPHPDCTVHVSDAELYECKDGRWWHILACESSGRSSELGLAMHAVDFELREQLHYAYPLKRREAPKYLWKIVRDTVKGHLERRAEAESRRITIDLSKLGEIRAAAAVTQEALLTDEERGEEPVGAIAIAATDQSTSPVSATGTPTGSEHASSLSTENAPLQQAEQANASVSPTMQMRQDGEALPCMAGATLAMEGATGKDRHAAQTLDDGSLLSRPAASDGSAGSTESSTTVASTPVSGIGSMPIAFGEVAQPAQDSPLSAEEAQLLTGLLEGVPTVELLGARAQFLSVVVDSINEKLFDVVGDAVIEFDGDSPCLVEDYLEDVREVLHL